MIEARILNFRRPFEGDAMTRPGWWCGLTVFGLIVVLGGPPARGADAVAAPAVGAQVKDTGSLRDLRGNRRPLRDLKGHPAVVLAFLGADCPISNLYVPGLVELEKKYRPQGVQF